MGADGREWEGAGCKCGCGNECVALARWRRWTGLGWGLPHCMIGPPNFPSYTCLPATSPINDLNHSASHLLPSPSHLAINHNPSLVISSPVNKVEKPSPIPFPFLFNQVSRPQPTPRRHSQPPFPKQTVPAPDGINLAWSRVERRLASLSSLRPRASALPLPRYALLALHAFAPCLAHLQAESPCGSSARGRASALVSPTAAPGVAGLAYTRNPTAERGASFLVMKSTTRNSASTPQLSNNVLTLLLIWFHHYHSIFWQQHQPYQPHFALATASRALFAAQARTPTFS